jgi:hypothetical protein
MNTKELIKLANIADKEGDLELADFIDRELLAMSNDKNIREAVDLGKYTRPLGNVLGKIPEFFGYGKYKAPANWSASGIDLMTQNPNRSGNAFQQALGSVDKEINLDANQVKNLETQLLQQLNSSMDQADAPTQEVIKKIINKDFKNISSDERALLGEFARKTGIIGRRTDADFADLGELVRGMPLQVRPRTVQRVNPKAKLIGGGLGALALAPTMYNTFAGQGPDTTGSAIPSGPMAPMGMPQLDPMGGFGGGFGGGYNGPQVGGPGMGGGYAPTQPIGLGYANSVMDPTSNRESAGYAPPSQYTGRSEREINPAAKFRSYEGMMRGEGAPAFNNQSYVGGYSQPTVAPVITPQVNVQPVAAPVQLDSIPPVAVPTAQELAGQPGFGGATDTAGIRAELYGDQTPEPQAPPLTPGEIQNAMNSPLATAGY